MSRIFNERRERAIFYVFKNYNSGRSALEKHYLQRICIIIVKLLIKKNKYKH